MDDTIFAAALHKSSCGAFHVLVEALNCADKMTAREGREHKVVNRHGRKLFSVVDAEAYDTEVRQLKELCVPRLPIRAPSKPRFSGGKRKVPRGPSTGANTGHTRRVSGYLNAHRLG